MHDNNNFSQVHLQHPASVDAYIRHGWKLVPIPPGTKGPAHEGWNLNQNTLKRYNDLPPNWGIGLAHAYSGTMALDIDHWSRAIEELKKHGIDLESLYHAHNAVIIDSGKPGHGKLLYKMPNNLILPSKKLIDKDSTGQKYNYIDFRCATREGKTVQDVLPPSIHPDTRQPYRWAGYGRWQELPEIPAQLLKFWQDRLNDDYQMKDATPVNPDSIKWDEIQEALFAISADISREEWVSVGMALHWAGHQTGQMEHAFKLWNNWSSTATGTNWEGKAKYQGERDLMNSWRSFSVTDNAITTGTLYDMAYDAGFRPKDPDVSALFESTEKPILNPKDILYPPPPDVDLTLFPPILAKRAHEIAEHIGCDPLVPLWAGLACVCGAIDARTRLELLHGFKVAPVLWMMTIGEPADKKSPGSKPMFDVLKDIEKEDRPHFKKRYLEWQGLEAAHNAAHKAFMDYCASPEHILSNDAPQTPADLPPQPEPLKITVSDITSQKLVRHAEKRPRGLLCYLDEMNSWVRKMASIQSGEDRSAWVQAYEADRYEMDRVGAGSIYCDHFAVSVYGNIQPQVFREHVKVLSGDGLLQRFIPAVLRSNLTKRGNPVPDELTSKSQWDSTVRQLYTMPAITYKLSYAAQGLFRDFQEWYENKKFNERILKADPVFMTAFGKMEGLVGRLCLLWHVLQDPYSIEVPATTMEQVIEFIRSYHVPAIRYAYDAVGGLVDESLDYWLMEHIIYHADQETIELRDIKHSARRQLDKAGSRNYWEAGNMIKDAMINLELCNWVQLQQETKKGATWVINPHIKEMFKELRDQVIKARQSRLDENMRKASKNHKGKAIERKLAKHYDPDSMDE